MTQKFGKANTSQLHHIKFDTEKQSENIRTYGSQAVISCYQNLLWYEDYPRAKEAGRRDSWICSTSVKNSQPNKLGVARIQLLELLDAGRRKKLVGRCHCNASTATSLPVKIQYCSLVRGSIGLTAQRRPLFVLIFRFSVFVCTRLYAAYYATASLPTFQEYTRCISRRRLFCSSFQVLADFTSC